MFFVVSLSIAVAVPLLFQLIINTIAITVAGDLNVRDIGWDKLMVEPQCMTKGYVGAF